MSAELEQALLALIDVVTILAVVWSVYGFFAFWKLILARPDKIELSGGTTVTEKPSDNIYTETAAKKTAEGVVKAAQIKADADVKVAELNLEAAKANRQPPK